MLRPFTVAFAALTLVGCSESSGERARTGHTREAIIHGTDDTTHDATVAIKVENASQAGECTGTVVKNAGGTALVLTAAHCFEFNPTTVTVYTGTNFEKATGTYPATKWALFPTTGAAQFEPGFDLALITITGVPNTVPAMPLLAPAAYSDIKAGHSFLAVGFGQNDTDAAAPHTMRKQLTLGLQEFEQTYLLMTSPAGSACFGDSGGTIIDVTTGSLAAVIKGGVTCENGSINAAIGFYPPRVSQWLRDNGLTAPAATLMPLNADCTSDAMCTTGACQHVLIEGGGEADVCGDKLDDHFACLRNAQCKSNYCHDGGCQVNPDPDAAVVDDDAGAPPVDAGGSSTSSTSSSSGTTSPPVASSSSSASSTSGTPAAPPAADDSGCNTTNGGSSGAFGVFTLLALSALARRRRR